MVERDRVGVLSEEAASTTITTVTQTVKLKHREQRIPLSKEKKALAGKSK